MVQSVSQPSVCDMETRKFTSLPSSLPGHPSPVAIFPVAQATLVASDREVCHRPRSILNVQTFKRFHPPIFQSSIFPLKEHPDG